MITLLDTIHFRNPITGYFPSLEGKALHGFSWGKEAGNMSYNDDTQPNEETTKSIRTFYEVNGFPSDDVQLRVEHGDTILDLSREMLGGLDRTEKNIFAYVDAAFTMSHGLAMHINPADCSVSCVYAKTHQQEEVVGLIHAGRDGADKLLPQKAITHLVKGYGIDPENITIGITPTISKEVYKLENTDNIRNRELWGEYIREDNGYYVDVAGFVVSQYIASGIPEENISMYTVDTYHAATTGDSFSYYYSSKIEGIHQKKRFRVVIALP